MDLALPFGPKKITFEVPFPPGNLAIARRCPVPLACEWDDLAARALGTPIGAEALADMHLQGKSACVVIDRSVRRSVRRAAGEAADRMLPAVIDQLEKAKARKITILAAWDDAPAPEPRPRPSHALRKKHAWEEHDPFAANHRFYGFSTLGTPIFINGTVGDSDFRVAVGTVLPHVSHGYTGGYDALLPGAASFECIARNRALVFSPNSSYGHLGTNPCRLDLENAGAAARLDFILDFVVALDGSPLAAFAGHPIKAHRAAVNFGDRMVWGAELGGLADAAIASPGDRPGDAPFDPRAIDFVAGGVKPRGSIIYLANPGPVPLPEDEFELELHAMTILELAQLHEKRDWSGDNQEILGDSLDAAVRWNGGGVGQLRGRPVRLRFVLHDADLYSFQFAGE